MSTKEKKLPKKKTKVKRFQDPNEETISIRIFNKKKASKTVKTDPVSISSNFHTDPFSPMSSIQNSNGFNLNQVVPPHSDSIRQSLPYEYDQNELRVHRNNAWKNKTTDLTNQVYLKNGNYFEQNLIANHSLRDHFGKIKERPKQKSILDSMNSLPIKRYAPKGRMLREIIERLFDSRDIEPSGGRLGLESRDGQLYQFCGQLGRF